MINKKKFLFTLSVILIVNSTGILLKYFNFDTYFVFIGFRFHFSTLISFLLILNHIDFSYVKELFVHPEELFVHPVKQRFVFVLLIAFLPLLFVPLDMFVLKEFGISEQDYFFELGLSSFIDYPVYMIWNAPQMFMLFIFVNTVLHSGQKFLKTFLLTFFLFLYEFIPLELLNGITPDTVDYNSLANFILIIMLNSLFISRLKNIYIFSVIIFTVLWGTVLFFGSSSKMLINILLAAQYESWAGLINLGKKFLYAEYFQSAYLLVILILSFLIIRKNNQSFNYKK